MGRKKLFLDLKNRMSSADTDSEDDSSADSDEELQKAFARGDLKPGLNTMVAVKTVDRHPNDRAAMKAKLDEIRLDLDWIERLDSVDNPSNVTPEVQQLFGNIDLKLNKKGEISAEESDQLDKCDNDFKREMLFYRRAQTAVLEGIPRLRALRVVTKRPNDYFAEMAKPDDHMKKVRETIVRRQTALEASDKAKKMRELKKYGKKIQTEVLIKRQKEKRQMMDRLKKYKSGKEDNLDFLDSERPDGHNDQKKQNNSNNKAAKKSKKPNQKEKYKQSKFGYGGQKKRSKYNTSSSSADMTKFSRRRNAKPSKSNQRPGKSVRQRMKNKS